MTLITNHKNEASKADNQAKNNNEKPRPAQVKNHFLCKYSHETSFYLVVLGITI